MRSNPLVRPDEFFARGMPSGWGAVAVVVGTGVVAVANGVPLVTQQNPDFSALTVLAGVLLGGVIGGVAIWTLLTLVVHAVTVPLDGFGPVTRTAVFVGWGLAPMFVVNAVTAAVTWWAASRGALGSEGALPEPAATVSLGLGVAGTLWVGYVLTYAIKEGRNVSKRHAAAIAGAFVLAELLRTAGTLF